MNNPDHISDSLENKYRHRYLMQIWDPGWKRFGSGIRHEKISDPG
jgi:hypothetical protein